MKQAPKNSIIIYLDSGLSIKGDVVIAEDVYAQKPFLENMVEKETIKSIGIALKKNEHIKPLWAAFIAVKNTEHAQKFIETWLGFCEQKELIIQHLNDQMLLGLLAHKYPDKVYVVPTPVFFNIFEWHHRKTNPEDQSLSLLPCLFKHTNHKPRRDYIINSKIFQVIRGYISNNVNQK